MFFCAWCLNLANNAAMPPRIEWDGQEEPQHPVGSEQMARILNGYRDFPGFRIRTYRVDIVDPIAVTMIDGSAACSVHAGSGMRWDISK